MATVKELEGKLQVALSDVSKLQVTVGEVKVQLGRVISDIESEKGTRQRQDERLEKKLDEMQEDITVAIEKNTEKREAQIAEIKKQQEEQGTLIQKVIWIGVGVSVILAPFASKLVDKLGKLVGLE